MKAMKKVMAIMLAVMLIMAMAATVSAATVTIKNAQPNTTYTFYKIFNYDDTHKWYKVTDEWKNDAETYFDFDSNGYVLGLKDANTLDTAIAAGLKEKTTDKAATATVNTDASVATDTIDLEYGYYLMISNYGDTNLASLAEITADGLTIREKNTATDLPQVKKEISGLSDDYKVGDVANFTVTVICEEGKDSYTIHDKMTGLELIGDITVTVPTGASYETKNPSTVCASGCTFEVVVTFGTEKSQAYDEIKITYKAKVTEAAMSSGATNQTWIDSKSDEVVVTKYQFTLEKTDGTKKLDGATFKLYSDAECTNEIQLVKVDDYYRPATDSETAAEISAGTAVIKGLSEGTYYLKETKAPIGYQKIEAATSVTITKTTDSYTVNGKTPETAVTITNTSLSALPETGGMGTTIFYTVGAILVLAAVVLLATKKRSASK